MKFEIKNVKECGYGLFDKREDHLIQLGNIVLMKENKKNESCCFHHENNFNYHGIKKALCGKIWNNREYFTPKRITVIQMN